ncbi:hypothetical protein BE17_52550 [Sorangium cellulosum]|uniref:Uncharacterized protein n=1 Tax=Sorangium cellulosum TaxID=56 RepID=A0A150QZJ3_SORCE|nr:hypothetical protein BE17_52550 [Sorangium cellulosum]
MLMQALKDIGTVVWEPLHRSRFELPGEAIAPRVPLLTRGEGVRESASDHGRRERMEDLLRVVRRVTSPAGRMG